MSTKKSWRDRLADYPHLPNVKEIPPPMRKRHGEGTIATPSPREVEDAMRGQRYFVEDFAKKLSGTR